MGKALALGSIAVLLVSGCSAVDSGGVTIDELEHIHSVATDGEQFFLASHHGLYVWSGESWQLRGDEFDIMGLALDNDVFYASGHPGPSQNFPDPLGVIVSRDNGSTWEPLLLTGEVDFHLLEVIENTLVGVAANYGQVIASSDFGATWSSLDVPTLTSLSVNPSHANEILLASDGALFFSSDLGASFLAVDAPPGIILVDWSTSHVYLASASTIYRSATPRGDFVALAEEFANIQAISADGDAIIVLDDKGVHTSKDGGKSFALSH